MHNDPQLARSPATEKAKYRSWIAGALLILGLYYPTSTGSKFTALSFGAYLICLALLTNLAFGQRARRNVVATIVFLSIVPLLVLFTATSPLPMVRLGAGVGYGVLSVLFLADVRDIQVSSRYDLLWIVINIINLLVCVSILIGVRVVDDFIIKYYSYSYEELLPNMVLIFHQPVATFATHSTASFYWYIFFWINLEGYRLAKRRFLAVLSVCYLLLTLSSLSVTGLILFVVGVAQWTRVAWSSVRHRLLIGFAGCMLLALGLAWGAQINWRESFNTGKEILQNPRSGFFGRFHPGGTMYYDLEYLKAHPFRPIGFSSKSDLSAGDSGIIEYLLRGSLPLFLLIYGGLYYFLSRNLRSKVEAYYLFCVFLAFELGMSNLEYFRTLYLLPAFVIYLNRFNWQQTRPTAGNGVGGLQANSV